MHVRGSAPSLESPPMPEELAASNLIQDIRIRSAECVTPEYEIPAHPAKLAMKDTSGTAAQPAMKRTRRRQHHPLLRYRPPGRRPLERLSDSATASGYSALSLCCCKSVMHCVSPVVQFYPTCAACGPMPTRQTDKRIYSACLPTQDI